MRTSALGIGFIKKEELFVGKPYLDAVKVPTIGYGSTMYENGKKVTMNDAAISEAQASELFAKTLVNYENAVTRALKVSVTQNQFDALVSFAYNVGVGGMAQSTLLKKINAGITDAATITQWFGVWNKGTINGKKVVLPGLVTRRKKEANLFLKAV